MNKMQRQPTSTSSERVICDALGCFETATQTVNLVAGNKGLISLRVCDSCIFKFNKNIHKPKKIRKGAFGLGQASREPAAAHAEIGEGDP
jgi:hypothetical protein